MNPKTRIKLSPEQETLLITIFAKAQVDDQLFFDPKAIEIVNHVDYDFSKLKVPRKTVILIRQRAKKLDQITRDFLKNHPDSLVIQLGCGLDSRFWRVDDGQVEWYDLDMPQVIELHQRFFEKNERYHLISSEVTDLEWMEAVRAQGKSVLVLAEGLLMYLGAGDVQKLVLGLQKRFPGCRLAADVFSRLASRSAGVHPSLRQVGATLGWGIDDPCELEAWAPGLELLEEWSFTEDKELAHLSFSYRLAYKIAGAFKMVRRAHRIVYYQI